MAVYVRSLGVVSSSLKIAGIPQETTPVAFQWEILSDKISRRKNRLMEAKQTSAAVGQVPVTSCK